MACLEMFNTEHQGLRAPPMSPRISFSNGFVDAQQQIMKHDHHCSPRESPSAPAAAAAADVSSDFEFSVTNYSMLNADELFFRGRLLPSKYKDNCTNQLQKMTLRDELLIDDDDDHDDAASPRPSKGGTIKWKELLGLKRPQGLSKKTDKIIDGSLMEPKTEAKGSIFIQKEATLSKISAEEMLEDGTRGPRDVDTGV